MQRAKACGLDQDPPIPDALRQVIAEADEQKRLLTTDEI
ncbi:hypothetical protein WH7805_06631 [Synechococcus sp. WH 7805]|nr:hypothetical protein WH7805_06631 [Synechococcus sp. WH 7805]